jgi:hypothetical protein
MARASRRDNQPRREDCTPQQWAAAGELFAYLERLAPIIHQRLIEKQKSNPQALPVSPGGNPS